MQSATRVSHPDLQCKPASDYLQWVHDDYRYALERLERASDSLQSDFKMFIVVMPLISGAIAGLSGVQKFDGIELTAATTKQSFSLSFWAFAALTTVVAAISFRDYVRAVGFEHALYTAVRFERHYARLIRATVPATAGSPVLTAQLFVKKFQANLGKLVAVASVVYSIPTLIAPPIVLALLRKPTEAFVMLGYSSALTVLYVAVGQIVLGRYTDLFRSVTDRALEADDPEPR